MSNITEQHVIENTVFTPVNATYQHEGTTVAITAASAFTAMDASVLDESGCMAFRVAEGRMSAIAMLLNAAANGVDGGGKRPSDDLRSFAQGKIAGYVIDALEQHVNTPAKDSDKDVSGASAEAGKKAGTLTA